MLSPFTEYTPLSSVLPFILWDDVRPFTVWYFRCQTNLLSHDFIQQKAGVLRGKAVVRGTRIAVDLIFEKMGADETIDELLKAYPFLSKEAILACVKDGAASVR